MIFFLSRTRLLIARVEQAQALGIDLAAKFEREFVRASA